MSETVSAIRSIWTTYKGITYRSRAEARWAVFFDKMGIEAAYEPEGFVLPSGACYLPDFYLPGYDTYVEVKGVLYENNMEKGRELAIATKKTVMFCQSDMHYEFFNEREECPCDFISWPGVDDILKAAKSQKFEYVRKSSKGNNGDPIVDAINNARAKRAYGLIFQELDKFAIRINLKLGVVCRFIKSLADEPYIQDEDRERLLNESMEACENCDIYFFNGLYCNISDFGCYYTPTQPVVVFQDLVNSRYPYIDAMDYLEIIHMTKHDIMYIIKVALHEAKLDESTIGKWFGNIAMQEGEADA